MQAVQSLQRKAFILKATGSLPLKDYTQVVLMQDFLRVIIINIIIITFFCLFCFLKNYLVKRTSSSWLALIGC